MGILNRSFFWSKTASSCIIQPSTKGTLSQPAMRSTASAGGLAQRTRGFTLIELLVVIGIIAILAGLLLPALSRAKRHSLTIVCLNNLRQLEVCWHSYAMDHNDVLVPNNSIAGIDTNGPASTLAKGTSWCLADPTDVNVQVGMLWDYNQSLGIYHCPADRSTL